jgi:hypothetical protein
MDNTSSEQKDQTVESPAPEVLTPRTESDSSVSETSANPKPPVPATPKLGKRHHNTYHPSHKATFIGLVVVVAVLAINAGIIAFVIKGQSKTKNLGNQGEVTISQGVLNRLGVNRSTIGDTGVELVVGPNARFNGKLQIGGDTSVAGQLKLNGKLSAPDASLAQLEAGNTSLSKLNVNGDSTLSALNLRNNLAVAGTTRLQGAVTVSQLLTVNNNVNISGSVAVGGTLSVNSLSTRNLILEGSLTVGGHIITRGSAPGVGPGSGIGSNGTVSISGNDAAGTVAVNAGTGAGNGVLVNVAFRSQYGTTPHVVISPVGRGDGNFYVNRSIGGFSIAVTGSLGAGGYAFDYIVEQ